MLIDLTKNDMINYKFNIDLKLNLENKVEEITYNNKNVISFIIAIFKDKEPYNLSNSKVIINFNDFVQRNNIKINDNKVKFLVNNKAFSKIGFKKFHLEITKNKSKIITNNIYYRVVN